MISFARVRAASQCGLISFKKNVLEFSTFFSGLFFICGNPLPDGLIILLIPFKSSVIAAGIQASNGRGAGTHTGIQYQISWIGISANQILKQFHWFLGWVQTFPLAFDFQYLPRIMGDVRFRILSQRSHPVHVIISRTYLFPTVFDWMIQNNNSLRMVHRLLSVKDTNLLHAPKRLLLGVCKASHHIFVPIPAVFKHLWIAADQLRGKWLAAGQGNCSVWLDDAQILAPKLVKRKQAVPSAASHPIRKITKDHVHTLVWIPAHSGNTVFVINLI